MLPKMNPKQMAQMMRQFGISTQEIDADKVVIHKKDGSQIEIRSPSVVSMNMQGETSFQISGEAVESGAEESKSSDANTAEAPSQADTQEDDVRMVMEQAKVSREDAEAALKESGGDIASAIVKARKE